MKIIIYGMGRGLQFIEESLKKEHEIIGYSDSFLKLKIFHGKPFYSIDELKTASERSDYIILAIFDKRTALEMQERLCREHGIPLTKILPFYSVINQEMWALHLNRMQAEGKNGVILGNSCAYHGLCEDYLSEGFENFALPCQDMYFNCCIFEEILRKNVRLDYLWFDLCDYNYFNIDISRTKHKLKYYISIGGITRPHNYSMNNAFSDPFETWVKDQFGIVRNTDGTKLEDLFELKDYIIPEKPEEELYRCLNGEPSVPVAYMGEALQKRREDTISENIKLFVKIIKLAKNNNPKIRILFTLLPLYISLEKARNDLCGLIWKEEYLEIMEDVCKKYDCLFLNYKNCEAISGNSNLYFEAQHMNKIGSKCMTSIIDNDLENIGFYKRTKDGK